MRTGMLAAIAGVVLVGSLVGCDADSDPGAQIDRISGVAATAPPTNGVPRELQGTWRLDVYCAAPGADVEQGGFGEIIERPARSEGVTAGRTTMTMSLYPEYFEIAWLQPERTWRVGWSGPAVVDRGTLYLDHRHLEGIRDSFTWSLDGHRLSLHEEVATSGIDGDDTPSEAQAVASFSLPWTAIDCPPRQG